MNTKRLFTARATAWLNAWHEHAIHARIAKNHKFREQARLHARNARVCLQNFRAYCNDKPYKNGIPK